MNNKIAQNELDKKEELAQEILSDESKAKELADKLEYKYDVSLKNKGPIFFVKSIKNLKEDVPTLISLLRSYLKKEYRQIPYGTIVAIAAGLIYFLAPADLIPDFIPGLGLIDDASVIAFCYLSCKNDIDNYSNWLKYKDAIDAQIKTKENEENS